MVADDTAKESEEHKLPTSSKTILWGAGIFSGLWIIAAVAFGIAFHSSDAEFNEWGDYISGTSAPLAFIWLVVAVMLQSTELREQRKELALTRREFEYNREVMKAQATEAKRQAEFIEQQTVILADNHKASEAEETFKASVELVNTRLRQYVNAWDIAMVNLDGSVDATDERVFRLDNKMYSGLSESLIIPTTVRTLRTRIRNYRTNCPQGALAAMYPMDFDRIRSAVIASADAISELPPRWQIKAKTLELDALKSHVQFLAEKMPKQSFFASLADDA